MSTLDETDLEILSLLGEDARRPYSEIGDAVGLSGPAVSDRVSRLRESGVIERFTVQVDRSQLRAGVPVFVRTAAGAGTSDDLLETVAAEDAVEHAFVTAEGDVWFTARVQGRNVHRWLEGLLAEHADVDYEVTLLDDLRWEPSLDGTEFALACAECGNTVDSEGTSVRVDGDTYHFCCPSCRSRFEERYERIEEGA